MWCPLTRANVFFIAYRPVLKSVTCGTQNATSSSILMSKTPLSKPISLFSKMRKISEVYRRNNNGTKTHPCSTPDTTLTSLLRQPSTITCDRFDKKLCQYSQHGTSNTHRAELIENSLMVDPIKSSAEVDLHNSGLLPSLQCTHNPLIALIIHFLANCHTDVRIGNPCVCNLSPPSPLVLANCHIDA